MRRRRVQLTVVSLASLASLALVATTLSLFVACSSDYGGEDEDTAEVPTAPPSDGSKDAQLSEITSPAMDGDGLDGSGGADADAGPKLPCDINAPFTTIAPIAEVNTPNEESFVHVSSDELQLYLSRDANLAVYTRLKIGDPWQGGDGLDINTGNQANVRITDDTLRAYFDAHLGGGINAQRLHVKSRPTKTSGFQTVASMLSFSSDDGISEDDAWFSTDEKTTIFSSNRLTSARHLYTSTKDPMSGAWSVPSAVSGTEPKTDGAGDYFPVATEDRSAIYFTSTRAPANEANRAILLAVLKVTTYDVASVPSLAVAAGDSYPTTLSKDRCRLYFISNRTGSKGLRDVWLASR